MALFSLKKIGLSNSCITNSKRPLHNDGLLRLPHPQDRHTSNNGIGIVFSCGVDSVVGSNNEGKVGVGEVIVKFIHFQHNIVWYACLGKKDIKLSRHPSSDWVNTK